MLDDEAIEIPSVVPVFPLPEVVLFPRAVLPLHVFEPRYREMTADALDGAGIVAIALLKPGFEPRYYSLRAPIHRILGLGEIAASEQLDDGNYNILLRGVARARISKELPHKPYRVARVEPLESPADVPCSTLNTLRQELRQTVETEFVGDREVQEHWLRLFGTPLELGDLTDLIASVLPIDAELRQDLLAQPNPATRSMALREHIHTLAAITQTRRRQCRNGDWKMN